jgi:hypothetical protein
MRDTLSSSVFKSKINAIGISNLPVALQAINNARKQGDFVNDNYSFVTAGVFSIWPDLIQLNAILNIAMGVKESIDARNKKLMEESQQQAEQPQAKTRRSLTNLVEGVRARIFPSPPPQHQDSSSSVDEKEDVRSSVTLKLAKAKALLAGKRDSAFDDIVWGVFHVSSAIFNVGRMKAIGHAWLVFLIHLVEETVLNDEITWKQKQKRNKMIWLIVLAYISGRLLFFCKKCFQKNLLLHLSLYTTTTPAMIPASSPLLVPGGSPPRGT